MSHNKCEQEVEIDVPSLRRDSLGMNFIFVVFIDVETPEIIHKFSNFTSESQHLHSDSPQKLNYFFFIIPTRLCLR